MLSRPAPNEIELIFTPLLGSPELLGSLWQILSSDEREKASRFHFERHRKQFVVARGLLRILLASRMAVKADQIQFEYGAQGKPALAGAPGISFNSSHSEQAGLFAIGCGEQLGVDLEHIRAFEDMTQIAAHYFCPAEHVELLAVPEDLKPQAFFNCWTRKEAFVKAIGEGLSHPLDTFRVTLQPGHPAAFVSIGDQAGHQTEWSLYDVTPCEGYAAALAVKSRTCQFRLQRFESADACAHTFGFQ